MCMCFWDQMKFVGLVRGCIFSCIDQLVLEEVG